MASGEKIGDAYIEISARLDKLDKGLKNVEGKTSKTAKKMESSMSKAFKKIGAAAIAAFATDKLIQFGQEALRLAEELEGVSLAFNRIGNSKVLAELQEATRGTVSELELMKQAVQAQNLGVPIEKLGQLFAFATQRAADTGESVDHLVQSITVGIGRKSPLILDNLGISAIALKEALGGVSLEAASVGDIAEAVGKIASASLDDIGETALTSAQKTAELNAKLLDVQTSVGTKLVPAANEFKKAWVDALTDIDSALDDDVSFWTKMRIAVGHATNNQTLLAIGQALATGEKSAAAIANDELLETEKELTEEVAKTTIGISATELAILNLLNTTDELTIGNTRLAESYVSLSSKALPALNTGVIPAMKLLSATTTETDDSIVGLSDSSQYLADVVGSGLAASFDAALINGQSFTETLGDYFKNLAVKIAAAAVAAAALAAILSISGLGGGLKFLDIGKNLFSGFAGLPAFASGGQVPGGTTLVGEKGPELVNLPRNAMVTPNHELGSMGGRQGRQGVIGIGGVLKGNDIFLSNSRTDTRRVRTGV